MKDGFGFRSLHPLVLLVYYAGGITFGMLLFHPIVLLAAWASHVAVNFVLDGGREWRRWAWPTASGVLLFFLINPLVSHRGRTVLTYLGDMPITLESIVYGATMALALLNVMTMFGTYRLVMTEQKFLYLFARFSPRAALLVMMTAGLVPRLRRRLSELALVQRTRGVTITEGSLRARASNGARLLQTLLAWTLEDALQTADSMEARGYGTGPRSVYSDFRFRRRDLLAAALLIGTGAALFAGWLSGYGALVIYPRLESMQPEAGDAAMIVVFILYILLPTAWEWRDRRAWRMCSGGK